MNLDRRSLLRFGAVTGASTAAGIGGWSALAQTAPPAQENFPDEIMKPVEVTGPDAVPIQGRLPGAQRMYVLPSGAGEYHQLGSMVMTRAARPAENGGTYELMTFSGVTGSAMPRHAHLGSHAAFLVMSGDVELELDGQRWRMLRGDFANIPPGVAHAWTMRSDRSKVALFVIGARAGASFVAMGKPAKTGELPPTAIEITASQVARASLTGDFQPRPPARTSEVVRVANLLLPQSPGPYVLLDGGGERYGANTFCARNINTGGQFLFIMTEGGADSPGVGAHFHARHTEDFFALDGETAGWGYGKALIIRDGDLFHAPPRHMHGFKMLKPYNRFVGFLTPGIFEPFFTGGAPGRNGAGGRGAGEGALVVGGQPGRPSLTGRGPDGYPLDNSRPTKPLPPQDPLWLEVERQRRAETPEQKRLALLAQYNVMCGGALGQLPMDPVYERALAQARALKPKAEAFI